MPANETDEPKKKSKAKGKKLKKEASESTAANHDILDAAHEQNEYADLAAEHDAMMLAADMFWKEIEDNARCLAEASQGTNGNPCTPDDIGSKTPPMPTEGGGNDSDANGEEWAEALKFDISESLAGRLRYGTRSRVRLVEDISRARVHVAASGATKLRESEGDPTSTNKAKELIQILGCMFDGSEVPSESVPDPSTPGVSVIYVPRPVKDELLAWHGLKLLNLSDGHGVIAGFLQKSVLAPLAPGERVEAKYGSSFFEAVVVAASSESVTVRYAYDGTEATLQALEVRQLSAKQDLVPVLVHGTDKNRTAFWWSVYKVAETYSPDFFELHTSDTHHGVGVTIQRVDDLKPVTGRAGETLGKLAHVTGALVKVADRGPAGHKLIIILGSGMARARCRAIVELLTNVDLDRIHGLEEFSKRVSISEQAKSSLLDNHAATLRSLEENHGVMTAICPEGTGHTLVIVGAEEKTQAAEDECKKLVAEMAWASDWNDDADEKDDETWGDWDGRKNETWSDEAGAQTRSNEWKDTAHDKKASSWDAKTEWKDTAYEKSTWNERGAKSWDSNAWSSKADSKKTPECKEFKNGWCSRGAKCRYLHVEEKSWNKKEKGWDSWSKSGWSEGGKATDKDWSGNAAKAGWSGDDRANGEGEQRGQKRDWWESWKDSSSAAPEPQQQDGAPSSSSLTSPATASHPPVTQPVMQPVMQPMMQPVMQPGDAPSDPARMIEMYGKPYDIHEWINMQHIIFQGHMPLPAGWVRCYSLSQKSVYYVRTRDMHSVFDIREIVPDIPVI